MSTQQITRGRIVLYTLSAADAEQINRDRACPSRDPAPSAYTGETFPAMCIMAAQGTDSASLTVFLDQGEVLWAPSRPMSCEEQGRVGEINGTWRWPDRRQVLWAPETLTLPESAETRWLEKETMRPRTAIIGWILCILTMAALLLIGLMFSSCTPTLAKYNATVQSRSDSISGFAKASDDMEGGGVMYSHTVTYFKK